MARPKRLDNPKREIFVLSGEISDKLALYTHNPMTGEAYRDSRSKSELIELLLREFFDARLPQHGEAHSITIHSVTFAVFGKVSRDLDPLGTGDSPAEYSIDQFSVFHAGDDVTNFLDSDSLELIQQKLIAIYNQE